jgi:hypothetical protein
MNLRIPRIGRIADGNVAPLDEELPIERARLGG